MDATADGDALRPPSASLLDRACNSSTCSVALQQKSRMGSLNSLAQARLFLESDMVISPERCARAKTDSLSAREGTRMRAISRWRLTMHGRNAATALKNTVVLLIGARLSGPVYRGAASG